MSIYLWGGLLGALVGLVVCVAIAAVLPHRPRLDVVLARLDGSSPYSEDDERRSVGSWLVARLGRRGLLRIPGEDLALLGVDPERFMIQRLLGLVVGAAAPLLIGVGMAAAEVVMPWPIPAGAALLFALAFAAVPDLIARSQAAERRAEFRESLATYLDLVALERSAGAAPNDALSSPAAICSGWAFQRIRQVLDQARASHEAPWTGLSKLGAEVGVSELIELADIAESAGREGTEVLATLLAKASSLRVAVQTAERAAANSTTKTMIVPIALSTTGFMVLVTFPAVYRLMISLG